MSLLLLSCILVVTVVRSDDGELSNEQIGDVVVEGTTIFDCFILNSNYV